MVRARHRASWLVFIMVRVAQDNGPSRVEGSLDIWELGRQIKLVSFAIREQFPGPLTWWDFS